MLSEVLKFAKTTGQRASRARKRLDGPGLSSEFPKHNNGPAPKVTELVLNLSLLRLYNLTFESCGSVRSQNHHSQSLVRITKAA